MRKNVAKVALCVAIVAFSFLSCGKKVPDRFRAVEEYGDCVVYVDTESGIGYAWIDGAMVPVYNPDGTHYRPNGWRDIDGKTGDEH